MFYIPYLIIFLIGMAIGAIWEQQRVYEFFEKEINKIFDEISKKLQKKFK
jgi:hypothetical protein